MAKPNAFQQLAQNKRQKSPVKTGTTPTATPTPAADRVSLPEHAPAVQADRDLRPHRISTKLSEEHNQLFTKLTYKMGIDQNKRPLPCEVLERAIETFAAQEGIELD